MKNPQHCFLDLGGVLFHVHENRIWDGFAAASPMDPEAIKQGFIQDGHLILFETGQIGEAEFWNNLREQFNLRLTDYEMESIWRSALDPIESNLNTARHTSENFPVSIISNINPPHLNRVRELAPWLSQLPGTYSHEIGFLKPRKEIYLHALEQNGIEATSACFIDDRADNVEGARELGIQAHQYEENDPFEEKLKLWLYP